MLYIHWITPPPPIWKKKFSMGFPQSVMFSEIDIYGICSACELLWQHLPTIYAIKAFGQETNWIFDKIWRQFKFSIPFDHGWLACEWKQMNSLLRKCIGRGGWRGGCKFEGNWCRQRSVLNAAVCRWISFIGKPSLCLPLLANCFDSWQNYFLHMIHIWLNFFWQQRGID